MSDTAKTAALLGIDFDGIEGDLGDDLGMTPEEVQALMEGSGGQDEDELMRSLSELGIDSEDSNLSSTTKSTAAAADALALMQQAMSPTSKTPVTTDEHDSALGGDSPPPSPRPSTLTTLAPPQPSTERPTKVESQVTEQLRDPTTVPTPDKTCEPTSMPSPGAAQKVVETSVPPTKAAPSVAKKPPPLRYGSEYKSKKDKVPTPPQGEDLMDDLFAAFKIGKSAVAEAFKEVKQSVTDLNSSELQVVFGFGDKRLGMRVERRPHDDACEVTWVEPGSAAARIGVHEDDVVAGVDGCGGLSYDDTLRRLTLGTRPMNLLLRRPQPLLNSPLNFKMETEIEKACRILTAITSKPTAEQVDLEDVGREVMMHFLKEAVGLVFMTTIKVGGLVSGMGGTGILVSRLPDGTWSAPVAVGAFGLSWGLQIGAAHADVMIVFMKPSALQPFCSAEGTDLHLGPESGIAVGPMGRSAGVSHGLAHLASDHPDVGALAPLETLMPSSLEQLRNESLEGHADRAQLVGAEVASRAKDVKPAYTYSHSKGLFVGVSLEGSVLTVRPDVNQAFYKQRSVDVGAALEGALERPGHLPQAKEFYRHLQRITGSTPPPLLVSAGPSPYTSPAWPAASPPPARGGGGGWVPPRDKWDAGQSSGSSTGSGGWVPPREKWGLSSVSDSTSNSPPVNPFVEQEASPFSEPSTAPASEHQHSKQLLRPQPQPPRADRGPETTGPPPEGAFSIEGGEQDGEEIVEFSV